jgi:hypothetical protein
MKERIIIIITNPHCHLHKTQSSHHHLQFLISHWSQFSRPDSTSQYVCHESTNQKLTQTYFTPKSGIYTFCGIDEGVIFMEEDSSSPGSAPKRCQAFQE